MAKQCGMIWVRPGPPVASYETVQCTYIDGHPSARHSWESLREQDNADMEAARAQEQAPNLPSDVRAMLLAIQNGNADAYLEVILVVAHDRKKTLRGVRGFPRFSV